MDLRRPLHLTIVAVATLLVTACASGQAPPPATPAAPPVSSTQEAIAKPTASSRLPPCKAPAADTIPRNARVRGGVASEEMARAVKDHVGPAITRLEMAIQGRDQAAERLAALI